MSPPREDGLLGPLEINSSLTCFNMTLLPNTLPNTTKVNLLKHEVRLVEGSEVRPVLKGEVS